MKVYLHISQLLSIVHIALLAETTLLVYRLRVQTFF